MLSMLRESREVTVAVAKSKRRAGRRWAQRGQGERTCLPETYRVWGRGVRGPFTFGRAHHLKSQVVFSVLHLNSLGLFLLIYFFGPARGRLPGSMGLDGSSQCHTACV